MYWFYEIFLVLNPQNCLPLYKTLENTGFHWPEFFRITTESTILSLYGRIQVSEKPYSRIFYAVYIKYFTKYDSYRQVRRPVFIIRLKIWKLFFNILFIFVYNGPKNGYPPFSLHYRETVVNKQYQGKMFITYPKSVTSCNKINFPKRTWCSRKRCFVNFL